MKRATKGKKRAASSHSSVSGGMKHIHQEEVIWTIENFENMKSSATAHLLRREKLNVEMKPSGDYPPVTGKVTINLSYLYDDSDDDTTEDENGFRVHHNYSSDDDDEPMHRLPRCCLSCGGLLRVTFKLSEASRNEDNLLTRLTVEILRNNKSMKEEKMDLKPARDMSWDGEKLTICKFSPCGDGPIPLTDGNLVLRLTFEVFWANSDDDQSASKRLKEAEFERQAIDDFKAHMEQTGGHVWIVVEEDGTEFEAFTAYLRARSRVFDAMLKWNMKETLDGRIVIPDLTSNAVRWMLKYVNTGILNPYVVHYNDKKKPAEDALEPCISELIYMAEKYEFTALAEHFDRSLKNVINVKNVKFLNQLANFFSMTQAQKDIQKFLQRNPTALRTILKGSD